GRPTNDGIVDEDDAPAFQQIAYRVELELHAEVTDPLLRFNERPADVVIADQTESKGDAALGGVSNGRRNAGVGNRNHQIGRYSRFARELATHLFTALLHPAVENLAVGAGKVDVLENAARLRNTSRVSPRGDAVGGHHDQFAGLDVALELGA